MTQLLGLLASASLLAPARAEALPGRLPTAVAVVDGRAKLVGPTRERVEPAVRTNAPSAFVADVATGRVLFSRDPHRVLPIASLTKLATAMVFLDLKTDMDAEVTMQAGDFDNESKPVFKIGDRFTRAELFDAMMVGSVNAAANALARSTLGTEAFVAAMNRKMRELNLMSPAFVEPSGIDPRNRANAADVAAMVTTAAGYPEVRISTAKRSVDMRSKSTNELYRIQTTNLNLGTEWVKPYQIVAAKTGSLPEAGYCMAQVTRSDAEGGTVVAVELAADDHFARYGDIRALTSWAFDAFRWK